jgi:Fic family protein
MVVSGEMSGENMTRTYIPERVNWPSFIWDSRSLASPLSRVRLRQGVLLGKMQSYGLVSRWTATLKVLTEETINSSAIEGVVLDAENVRSSLARQLGLDIGGLKDQCRWRR